MNRIVRPPVSGLVRPGGITDKNVRLEDAPPLVPEVSADGVNTLKIMYPMPGQLLPVELPVPVWVRYLDGNQKPKPNEPIQFDMSGYGSISPTAATTDADGWAVFYDGDLPFVPNATMSKPGTLGTVATFDATLTVTATNNSNDRDQAVLQASTSVGGPRVATFDDTVDSLTPGSDHVDNGVWTLVSGRCVGSDGTPLPGLFMLWNVSANPQNVLQPTVAAGVTYTDENGQFRNFVLTTPAAVDGSLTVEVLNFGNGAPAFKTYPCVAGAAPIGTTTLKLTNEANFGAGVVARLQAIYAPDQGSAGGKNVTWSSAPDAHLQYNATTTDGGGVSNNTARPDTKTFSYSDAVWADVTDGSAMIRGVLIKGVEAQNSPGPWTITFDPPSGSGWTIGSTYKVTATLKDGPDPSVAKPVPNYPIYWGNAVGGVFSFSPPYPTLTDNNGQATVQVTLLALPPSGVTTALLSAQATESTQLGGVTGWFECSIGTPYFEIKGGPMLALYQQKPLTGAYHAEYTGNPIEWLVDLRTVKDGYHFVFTPNPSPDNGGNTSTQLMAYGPNAFTTATVFARTYNPVTTRYDLSNPLPLSFARSAAPPDDGRIDLVSVDGDPLSEGNLHLIEATYTKLDGTPFSDVPITWTSSSDNVQFLNVAPTTTDEDGFTVNGVTAITTSKPFDATITASATNPITQKLEKTDLPLTFQATVAQSGSMTLKSKDEPPLAFNEPHDFTVTYLRNQNGPPVADGTLIYWTAYPADRISFAKNPSTVEGGLGQSINQVIAGAGPDINNAQIWAWSPNIQTGTNDYANLSTRFAKSKVQNLVGISLDKAYAQNLQFLVPPYPAQQLVKCQVQVLGQQGKQTVQLPTTPAAVGAAMYENNPPTYTALQRNPDTGNYFLITDDNGIGTFVVSATSYNMFDLNAQWQPPEGSLQTLTSPAKLVIATNDLDGSATPAPSIPSAAGGVLTIPPAPAPTFTVQVPSNKYTNYGGSQIALLLNDRMVYDGLASEAIKGVEVAYAALNLTGTNNLVYIGRAGTPACAASVPFQFTTTGGPPQTGPSTGGVARTLAAPSVNVPMGATIGPQTIADGGLQVELPPYPQRAADDVVTVYFYLSGKDVLTGTHINNIVPIIPANLSQLLGGQSIIVSLPQQYAAGYANGQLQVDYKVVSLTEGTRWSNVSPTYTLNTTF